ncbi:putative Aminoglycoside phosphotransferase domain-containing protein [Seiridium unicorne]|uniref:Aminoglycoside phosphotransferase domain-containing protein n=1 Tax=Seiridium unicorne TaxID=138068 RepID=A0ABR2URE9_9PEZI
MKSFTPQSPWQKLKIWKRALAQQAPAPMQKSSQSPASSGTNELLHSRRQQKNSGFDVSAAERPSTDSRGKTLQTRFATMDESERQAVCKELRGMVNAWRTLTQDELDIYIGSMGERPLNDIYVSPHPEFADPFLGLDAVQRFHDACDIEISGQVPTVFTHNDFCPPNILLSEGPNPKVIAILDWNQSGWYPWYWDMTGRPARDVL